VLLKKTNAAIELSNQNYVPVHKDTVTYYGGSQMWFPEKNKLSRDYVLHNYGCGTIATADLFLYLALQSESNRSPETMMAIDETDSVNYDNYDDYVRTINAHYTKTKRFIAVLGPTIASAVNSYSNTYMLRYQASWKWALSYYDMFEMISEMLIHDIPVILSIGPNTPNLWGKKGIPFYERYEVEIPADKTHPTPTKQYRYRPVIHDVNSHYVAVTAIIKDDAASTILLRISSWGKQYYIKYEEYRDYIENYSGTFTSSIVYIKKFLYAR
jgi:hypothetical protein